MFVADLFEYFFDGLFAVSSHGPGGAASTNSIDKVTDDDMSPGGVDDFWMELQTVDAPNSVFHRGVIGVWGGGDGFEVFGQVCHFVAMGVPDLDVLFQALE